MARIGPNVDDEDQGVVNALVSLAPNLAFQRQARYELTPHRGGHVQPAVLSIRDQRRHDACRSASTSMESR
jgi:hypothetical protein